jgi:hypothetical protein
MVVVTVIVANPRDRASSSIHDREGIIIDGDYAKIKVVEIDYYP